MNFEIHKAIAQRAEKIWQDYGQPSGRDLEIWLEAERQLNADATAQPMASPPLGEGLSKHAMAEKVALQRKEALAPQRSEINAPRAQPAETGKPLWSRPHSR